MIKRWVYISFINFGVASILGLLMRWAFLGDISPLSFRHLMHAHSHLAMLGWLFPMLVITYYHLFIDKTSIQSRYYNNVLLANQISVGLMTISFIIFGYNWISIAISSTQIIISYIIAVRIWKDTSTLSPNIKALVRWSLFWIVLSTLSIWLLPLIINTVGRNSDLYYMAVQFFLHFQFNGWFVFAALAILFHLLLTKGIIINQNIFQWFKILLITSCFLTYMLAVTWSHPEDVFFLTNSIGVVMQLLALALLFKLIGGQSVLSKFKGLSALLLFIAFLSFAIKILIQAAVVIPYVAVISYTIRQFVIGFIHLTLIGAISLAILASLSEEDIVIFENKIIRYGLISFLVGLVGSELVLFSQGLMLWLEKGFMPAYFEIIFGISTLMSIGLIIIIASQSRWQKNKMMFRI